MAKELVRSRPVNGILGLQDEVNDLFRDFFREFGGDGMARWGEDGAWAPAVDIEETDDSYIVSCDVPGLTQQDLKVSIENNILTIHGER